MPYLLLLLCILFYFFIIYKRTKKYKYSTFEDYDYNLEKNFLEDIINDSNISLQTDIKLYDTLFLKIHLSLNYFSYFSKPYIEIEGIKHYFEYGASGIRYINISHITSNSLQLILKNITLKEEKFSLYAYNNTISNNTKILILAPHADDAEIAAFGLYKSSNNITIVTTTAGENGNSHYTDVYNKDKTKQAIKKAHLRVFDALCVPFLGDVNIKDCLTLGYYGSSLQSMYENKDQRAISEVKNITRTNEFRFVSHSNFDLPLKVDPTYKSFVEDLKTIISKLNPDIIMTPHPEIDSHPDHKYTTLTAIDAIKSINSNADLMLYTNHLKRSETYPIGNLHSAITLPPNKTPFYFDSIYSFKLEHNLQIDKFFALESIHDLRDSLIQLSINKSFKHLNKLVKRKISSKDKSYYKRAVRANELFFIVQNKHLEKLL